MMRSAGSSNETRTTRLGLMTIAIAGLIASAAWLTLKRPVVLDAPALNASDPLAIPDMRLDLNAAGAAELALLPGVGPRLADRIVADRAERGPFASLEDLGRVAGVGPITLAELRPYVVVADQDLAINETPNP